MAMPRRPICTAWQKGQLAGNRFVDKGLLAILCRKAKAWPEGQNMTPSCKDASAPTDRPLPLARTQFLLMQPCMLCLVSLSMGETSSETGRPRWFHNKDNLSCCSMLTFALCYCMLVMLSGSYSKKQHKICTSVKLCPKRGKGG